MYRVDCVPKFFLPLVNYFHRERRTEKFEKNVKLLKLGHSNGISILVSCLVKRAWHSVCIPVHDCSVYDGIG